MAGLRRIRGLHPAPEELRHPGIFDLVMQVLGLTTARSAPAWSLVGEKVMARPSRRSTSSRCW
jgi:hypothetical protein